MKQEPMTLEDAQRMIDLLKGQLTKSLDQNAKREPRTNISQPMPFVMLVERWMQAAIRVQDTFGRLEESLMASPENEIRAAIWDMFAQYTRTLAMQLGDDAEDAQGWLEWFAWECDFGRKPMEMVFSDGETLLVVGASDLLAAILADENGCRVWDSPHNAESIHPESKP